LLPTERGETPALRQASVVGCKTNWRIQNKNRLLFVLLLTTGNRKLLRLTGKAGKRELQFFKDILADSCLKTVIDVPFMRFDNQSKKEGDYGVSVYSYDIQSLFDN
jgi:hypothetical protein